MDIKEVAEKDKQSFNKLALHPLQSWEWGEFREKTGVKVIRLGRYDDNKLTETAQITLHPIPHTTYSIGYFPKGILPSHEMLEKLVEVGKQYKCIFIKLEPNIEKHLVRQLADQNSELNIQPSPHPLFTKYTFQLDINRNEEELLKNMHNKTRYNIRVAEKHEVTVTEDDSQEAFEEYLRLTFETTRRQKFFAHDRRYHKLMWETLSKSDIAHLFTATYQDKILVAWIVFLFNGVVYYPYGASSSEHRNVMASNLMMWEAIKWGKKNDAKLFDMWGALGPDPDPQDPWYGFHRFKEGYGAKLTEFVGSYDLVINPYLYTIYNFMYRVREVFLKLKSYF
ncbi:hypothetical protein A2773_03925 [Candidatus Gottesmanbacteria bacterium RIFCSPHIGHO2_01_FULL_39_10]|uniref:BioF2-like acetyltransferase domain-containing protein n=1 Tax=Candidatus Gottesmanbacteria bacterium RIFCSPHIGHO2_01_FULL_39_10 TaxID=1798375 RepID=A0A1F5ZQF4_9BACT|nr:MAG: hypothetical protein A2773_03925 [Candidatus Gottesmanbacteria bacterium RIFCSPHIGHO2_01_FULL_39_10]